MDIVAEAFRLAEAVHGFMAHARGYYYQVMLSGHPCETCGQELAMVGEGRCRCAACGRVVDPTLAFQRCTACGGRLRLRRTRYQCRRCGADASSRFLFDGRVFDQAYFRQRMAESRERKQALRERVREMLAGTRSAPVEPLPLDLDSAPGLVEALDSLTDGLAPEACWRSVAKGFDLDRYQSHLQAHLGPIEVTFDGIPPLEEDGRLDRIWRFVAIIFMAHAGLLDIHQQGQIITIVSKNETDREG